MAGVAIITGSGRGIGAAAAKLAAKRGWAVCVNYLGRADRAEAVVKEIRAAGGKAVAVQADVSKEADARRLFERCDLIRVVGEQPHSPDVEVTQDLGRHFVISKVGFKTEPLIGFHGVGAPVL